MTYCGKCGTKVEEGIKFCPGCGNEIVAEAAAEEKVNAENKTANNDFSEKIASLNNTADTTADFDAKDIEQNKIMGVLAYLSWLVLIPIFAAPKSKFARYHANQGLVLAISEIAYWIATAIINAILYAISWRLGSIVSTLLSIINIGFLIITVIGIINAANGKAKELPIVGKFKILK